MHEHHAHLDMKKIVCWR